MQVKNNAPSEQLSPESIGDLNKLFAQYSPVSLREAVIRLYLCYATSDAADLPQDVEKIDKPVQVLIQTLGKIAGIK